MGKIYAKSMSSDSSIAYYHNGEITAGNYDGLLGDIHVVARYEGGTVKQDGKIIAYYDEHGNIYGSDNQLLTIGKCKDGIIYGGPGGMGSSEVGRYDDGDIAGAAAAAAVFIFGLGSASGSDVGEGKAPQTDPDNISTFQFIMSLLLAIVRFVYKISPYLPAVINIALFSADDPELRGDIPELLFTTGLMLLPPLMAIYTRHAHKQTFISFIFSELLLNSMWIFMGIYGDINELFSVIYVTVGILCSIINAIYLYRKSTSEAPKKKFSIFVLRWLIYFIPAVQLGIFYIVILALFAAFVIIVRMQNLPKSFRIFISEGLELGVWLLLILMIGHPFVLIFVALGIYGSMVSIKTKYANM